jgi:dihydrolipoamide dehydrogenase
MSNNNSTQLLVIGAGPGGYAAAFRAAMLGLDVTLVNAEKSLGGVCLNRGCIPSKALLHAAKLIEESREAKEWGIKFEDPEVDIDALRDWKNQVVGKLSGGIAQLAERRKVKVIQARAVFEDSETVRLEDPLDDDTPEKLTFEKAILASGSLPAIPGPLQVDHPRVMNSKGALNLEEVPGKMLVIGGGYIGLEMGTVYSALGSKVTVVEMLEGLLPGADRDLVKPLHKRLEKKFENIYLKTMVKELQPGDKNVKVTLEGEGASGKQTYDRVLICVGRRPNSKNIGLENAGIELDDNGFVKVNQRQETSSGKILAIGDVAGQPMLAHKATREGIVAAEIAAGHKAAFDNQAIPAVVFTDPEIAWCGIQEHEAKERGIDVEVARFPWAASGRALTLGRPEGLTKIVFEPGTERVLGVGMAGAGAGELIAEGVLAVEMAAQARDLAESIHAHPTLSETVMEAAEVFFGMSTHLDRPKK